MNELLRPEALVSLLTLTAMELVLGIDNLVVLSIVTAKLPAAQQARARRIGLFLAMFMRCGLLFAITWLMGLSATLFRLLGHNFTGRDLILIAGGAFLVAKATHEIYDKLEGGGAEEQSQVPKAASTSFALAIVQIVLFDLVFSIDSVLTAVGMARQLPIMVTAVIVSVAVMMFFARAVGDFVNRHPSMKVLALSFLILIGVLLVAEGTGRHVSRGYVYSAMAFSFVVELLNMRVRRGRARAVALREPHAPDAPGGDADHPPPGTRVPA